MYVYIYDEFSNQAKHGRLLYKIEKRLTDLGLNGKIVRLGISKNLKTAIDDEVRQGAKTIVAVGNDQTVVRVFNAMANNQSDEKNRLCLGIIPLEEKDSKIASSLGIKDVNDACDILLARKLESFNLARVNQGFFLNSARLEAPDTILEIDKNYIIQNLKDASIEITNNPKEGDGAKDLFDKKLALVVSDKDREGKSFFSFRELIIVNKNAPLVIDGALEIKTPAKISPSEEKIKIIVGRKEPI